MFTMNRQPFQMLYILNKCNSRKSLFLLRSDTPLDLEKDVMVVSLITLFLFLPQTVLFHKINTLTASREIYHLLGFVIGSFGIKNVMLMVLEI